MTTLKNIFDLWRDRDNILKNDLEKQQTKLFNDQKIEQQAKIFLLGSIVLGAGFFGLGVLFSWKIFMVLTISCLGMGGLTGVVLLEPVIKSFDTQVNGNETKKETRERNQHWAISQLVWFSHTNPLLFDETFNMNINEVVSCMKHNKGYGETFLNKMVDLITLHRETIEDKIELEKPREGEKVRRENEFAHEFLRH